MFDAIRNRIFGFMPVIGGKPVIVYDRPIVPTSTVTLNNGMTENFDGMSSFDRLNDRLPYDNLQLSAADPARIFGKMQVSDSLEGMSREVKVRYAPRPVLTQHQRSRAIRMERTPSSREEYCGCPDKKCHK